MKNMTRESGAAQTPLLFWDLCSNLLQRLFNYLKLRLSLLY